ncbi:uncharacterized protein [Dasypus novemcinctus]|uniref:uncharacterized protein isoform X7 n=1 Tax=Dasypus novemcinctus TaxID=9361 RepID=UPI0039C90C4C
MVPVKLSPAPARGGLSSRSSGSSGGGGKSSGNSSSDSSSLVLRLSSVTEIHEKNFAECPLNSIQPFEEIMKILMSFKILICSGIVQTCIDRSSQAEVAFRFPDHQRSDHPRY